MHALLIRDKSTRNRLREALRANAEDGGGIIINSRTTQFEGDWYAEEASALVNAIKSVPVHYVGSVPLRALPLLGVMFLVPVVLLLGIILWPFQRVGFVRAKQVRTSSLDDVAHGQSR